MGPEFNMEDIVYLKSDIDSKMPMIISGYGWKIEGEGMGTKKVEDKTKFFCKWNNKVSGKLITEMLDASLLKY